MKASTIGMCFSSLAIGMCISTFAIRNKFSNCKETLQEKVMEFGISTKEYKAINNRVNSNANTLDNVLTWQKALDSLQADAACKKAYLEGAQMVRDSIANAQKAE